jgi:hypothetical protein
MRNSRSTRATTFKLQPFDFAPILEKAGALSAAEQGQRLALLGLLLLVVVGSRRGQGIDAGGVVQEPTARAT